MTQFDPHNISPLCEQWLFFLFLAIHSTGGKLSFLSLLPRYKLFVKAFVEYQYGNIEAGLYLHAWSG